jgi:photosystem II stability/assembly factor-like uncharacterized protein
MSTTVVIGTRKGLFLVDTDDSRRTFHVRDPLLSGWEIKHACIDPRDGMLFAATNSWVHGGQLHRSNDRGTTWERAEGLGLPEESGLKLGATWHVEPGLASQPGVVWLGAEPACLFRSEDAGATFAPVRSLLEHPTRDRWEPGAGGLICHSIALDPQQPDRLYVGISAAGVFRSEDGGATWEPANEGTAADFLADDPYPVVGQCVHKVRVHPLRPDRLWQQNHCGVYRSDDRGISWERLDGNGLPSSFGFGLALDPADPDVAYVIPEEGADNRVTSDGLLGVYKTTDAGATWELAADGLPKPAWSVVLRDAMDFDPTGVVFGTQSGFVYARTHDGPWVEAARHLPPVLSVSLGTWP